ncbi:FAD-dependent oxidoreductase [Peredibacter starrii]|uniref:FAD-dependent oxidoreductase n=1 Tax=Peredibacter starrii TaxID=28202 RepID=A0AAX4HSC9_9BACT|nr:FAD-dependent oxidoreductase [Peredibacter starrii]WPU65910.1 FAD-dependent oxidoreductase [Peredibacter starrii]
MNEICIIGAGITGIHLAKQLSDSILLEKSRGVGGRIASRRLDGHPFNHGPQEIQIENISIKDPHKWIKDESKELMVLNNWEVTHLEHDSGKIKILGTNERVIESKKVILTCPAPQSKLILERSRKSAHFLEKIKYTSIVQFLVLTNLNSNFELLEKYFNLKIRRTLPNNQCFSLFEVKSEYLEEVLGKEKEAIKNECLSLVEGIVLDSHAHKWRYSEALTSLGPEHQFSFAEDNIFLAGDYFGSHGIKSSLESAQRLINYWQLI